MYWAGSFFFRLELYVVITTLYMFNIIQYSYDAANTACSLLVHAIAPLVMTNGFAWQTGYD